MVDQLAGYFNRLPKLHCVALSLALVAGIALLDYTSGYSLRLSLLYLIPIGLTAWVISFPAGIVTATLASMLWLLSFQKSHFYEEQIYYFWEAIIMLCSFVVVAWLSARLRLALSQADERFFRVVEDAQSAIYIIDEERENIVYGNPVMLALAGDLKMIDANDFEARFESSQDLSVQDKKTGRWYWRQKSAIPWERTARGKLVVLTDITAQKTAANLREKHLDSMHHSAQLTTLAETAATLAHEINQPLMVIATYTDACQRLVDAGGVNQEEVASILKKCHDQAVRASGIIERLREFIRQRQPKPTSCNTQDLLVSALEITRPQLEENRVQLKLTNPVPETIIEADQALLSHALANLIRNAIEAMGAIPPEQRHLSISVIDQDSRQLWFCVEDSGCGLDPAYAEKMFMPFVTTKDKGLGLGLSICKSIAEAHGGSLWAENTDPPGARFYLVLPKRQP